MFDLAISCPKCNSADCEVERDADWNLYDIDYPKAYCFSCEDYFEVS